MVAGSTLAAATTRLPLACVVGGELDGEVVADATLVDSAVVTIRVVGSMG
jgi:hypothetical protein